eukprot:GFUD01015939.1.p1 GENE.GFUD01015939.1~~GFUD01015939.1.p1  ORF type:complete len:612 (+),score=65.17 GFUD01015939.1:268-2103(+)
MPPRLTMKYSHRARASRVVPTSPTIMEVTEDSSPTSGPNNNGVPDKFAEHPRIQETEYTSLIHTNHNGRQAGRKGYGSNKYKIMPDSSGDNDSCGSASDEMSSNASVTSKMNSRQFLIFSMIILSSLSSSFAVCLFPPFFPRLAEMKGATATDYGLIIGTNCLVAFLVTPFVGNHLGFIGVKFAFCSGMFAGGVCCGLSGLLEFFEPGLSFIICSVLIRIVHAVANALVITSTFTYTATEFPTAVAKIFSMTRCVMNVAQLGGPVIGGLLYEAGGFFCPFVIMGSLQVILAISSVCIMPPPDYEDEETCAHDHKKKKNKVSVFKMLCIPTIWFSFAAFIIATMCNGFLSINLEPQVLRNFNFSPIYIGLLFGLKDGANSIASPFWGWICDRNKKSVKPYLIVSSVLVAGSFFLVGAGTFLGIPIQLSVPLLVAALCLNGAGIGGQQVVGVVDALHEASHAGYPASPSTQGLVAGLWSSLSGAGRFISRGGSGILVDMYGFAAVSSIACGLQVVVALGTFIYLVSCECSLVNRDPGLRWDEVTIVEQGRRRDERVVFTTNSSPSESLMTHSVYVGVPNNCSGHRMATRIANSMPPKKWAYSEPETNHSRSMR